MWVLILYIDNGMYMGSSAGCQDPDMPDVATFTLKSEGESARGQNTMRGTMTVCHSQSLNPF